MYVKVLVRISGTQRAFNKEAIFSVLEVIRKRVISDQDSKGIRSSGKSAQSLQIEEVSNGGQLVGDDYFQQQIAGRRPGKFPPIKSILDWINEKGISPTGISKKSLAFVIARKIARNGTDIFLRKRQALGVDKIVEETKPLLRDALIKAGRIEINTAIYKALGKTPPTAIRTQ